MATMTLRTLRRLLSEALLLEENQPIDAEQAMQLMKKFPKGMKKMGVNPDALRKIATGTRGTAFDAGNDKVFKVTNDEKEAQAASVMVGKDIKNIVHFYGVCRFGDTPFYGIMQEKLEPLPKEASNAFNKALVATGLPIWIKRAEGNWDNAKKLTKQYILEQVKKKFSDNLNSPDAQAYARGINEQWNLLVTKFGPRDMFNTLTQLGIDFHDYHAGNLMQRADGTMVLIDLGMSKVSGGGGNIETINQAMVTR
jgi:hypothetical protein